VEASTFCLKNYAGRQEIWVKREREIEIERERKGKREEKALQKDDSMLTILKFVILVELAVGARRKLAKNFE